MHKILLVDDEPRQLRSLASIIRRLRPHYEVLVAHNGVEALNLTELHAFDAVISDIRMPQMDGLELMENLYRRQYNALSILLTGYKDFEYARQAISWGIMDYIVKPISRITLESMLERLDDRFSVARKEQKSMMRMAKQLDLSLPVYQTYLLNKWILGRLNEEEREVLSEIIPFDGAGIIGHMECGFPSGEEPFVEQLQTRLENQWIPGIKSVFGFRLDGAGNKWGVVFLLQPQPNDSFILENLARSLDEWIANIEEEMGWTIQIGLGEQSDPIFEGAETSNRQAETALVRRFYEPVNRTVIYRGTTLAFDAVPDWFKIERSIAEAIQKSDAHKWSSVINEFMARFHLSQDRPPELMKHEMAHMLVRMAKSVIRAYSDEQFVCLEKEIRTCIMACMNGLQLRTRSKGLIERVADAYINQKQDPAEEYIRKCLSYVDERYAQDLSLDEIAAHFHFNSSYFSSLFKQRTGISLSMYITKKRMVEAKRILLETEDSISDIAHHVGYKDASYFIRIFKRDCGVSPYKFRHTNRLK
ncbi:response regulator transcription factor [Cohnella herbarum]|uniref:Response regulator n=1 Tax=Cohnella herbarum TaxID=2728023 RepID=A0A7Z2ZML2_9BACL|nr:response regulator [Cohnella herbarum]QJD84202.1 response regulator [Cohnella herbarum]